RRSTPTARGRWRTGAATRVGGAGPGPRWRRSRSPTSGRSCARSRAPRRWTRWPATWPAAGWTRSRPRTGSGRPRPRPVRWTRVDSLRVAAGLTTGEWIASTPVEGVDDGVLVDGRGAGAPGDGGVRRPRPAAPAAGVAPGSRPRGDARLARG